MTAGLHAACYGAYKDSPYETFKIIRFFREIIIGIFSAFLLLVIVDTDKIHPAIIFLTLLAFSRIITESYKQFIRFEPQHIYKIPSMFHLFRTVITSPIHRILIGICMYFVLFLVSVLSTTIYQSFPGQVGGLIIGFLSGLLTAAGGGYKDGFFEGFEITKFFRSPTVGAISGYFLSNLTNQPVFLLFASLGMERMIVEFYKGFIKAKYVPGKFKFTNAQYPKYFTLRRMLIPPYIFTWLIFAILVLSKRS